jgi:nitroreductase
MLKETEERAVVLEAIRTRRAVRAYAPDRPGEGSIRMLLDAAIHAPTAMHMEPWGFVIIQDKALLKRYSDRAKVMLLEEHAELLKPFGPSPRERMDKLADPAFNIFYDAGTLIVVCRTISGPYAEADCWLAAENLMLAAHAEGLGSCCIGFAIGLLNEPDVKVELGIPEQGAAVAPIIVGVPLGPVWRASRKPPQILRWIS